MNGSGSCEGISVFGFESVSVGIKSPGVEGFFLGISEGENGRGLIFESVENNRGERENSPGAERCSVVGFL